VVQLSTARGSAGPRTIASPGAHWPQEQAEGQEGGFPSAPRLLVHAEMCAEIVLENSAGRVLETSKFQLSAEGRLRWLTCK
jgi:hypothetical protein